MNTLELAQEALRRGCVLSLKYNGEFRRVEVHAVGVSKAGNQVMRAYEVDDEGASISHTVGFKLMTLAKAEEVTITTGVSQAPRPGYKEGDKDMIELIAELKIA